MKNKKLILGGSIILGGGLFAYFFLRKEYSNYKIVISAQHRLQHFYIDLGFTPRGEVYLEDNIDHIQMYFTPTQ